MELGKLVVVGVLAVTVAACGGAGSITTKMGNAVGTSSTGTAGTTADAMAGALAGGMAGVTAGGTSTGTLGEGGTPGMSEPSTECDDATQDCNACREYADGVYAMRLDLDVWWRDEINKTTPLADPGRGTLSIWFRGELTELDDVTKKGKGKAHPCGASLPTLYASANCTAIQIQFPDDLWDKPTIPDYDAEGSTTGFGPGDTLTIAKTVGLLGLALNDGAAFPTYMDTGTFACPSGTGPDCFPDQDMDGKPGITVSIRDDQTTTPTPYGGSKCGVLLQDYQYFGAPLSVLGAVNPNVYADSAQIGLRVELGGSGVLGADCMSGVGVGDAGDTLPSRVLHCHRRDGVACTAADEAFLDQNVPQYHILKAGETPPMDWKHPEPAKDMAMNRAPSKGPRSTVVRLGDAGSVHTCASVRGASFPRLD